MWLLGGSLASAGAGRIRGLDGLRAIAILLVILWHTAANTRMPPAALGPLKHLVLYGWTGVDLFFALSGFLITRLILQEEAARTPGPGFSLRRFYVRRALRILPPFFFVVLLNFALFSRFDVFRSVNLPRVLGTAPVLEVVATLTFWLNYALAYLPAVEPGGAFQVYWSLCVEEHFYLLWPMVLKMVTGRRRRVLLVLSACAGFCALRGLVGALGLDRVAVIQVVSHYRMDSILWGAVSALGFEWMGAHRTARRLALGLGVAATLGLMLSGHLTTSPTPLGQALGLSSLALLGSATVVATAAAPVSLGTRVLEWAPLREIGQISYGMYLLHMQMLDLGTTLWLSRSRAATIANFLGAYGFVCVLTFAAAWLMYRWVESPFLRLKSRFGPQAS